MGDIDFEELDRAISAFVSKKPRKVVHSLKIDKIEAEHASEPEGSFVEPVIPQPEPAVVVEQASQLVIEKTLQDAVKPSPASRRSSGRFMDVIHPTITNLKKKVEIENQTENKVVPDIPSAPRQETPTDQPAIDSTDSVFLADTKVEKRPLGQMQEQAQLAPRESVIAPQDNFEPKKEVTFRPVEVTDKPDESSSTTAPNIVPQYQESQAQEVQPVPIYDTNVVSQEASEQKSGWWWVLWILGLIILGVGSGLLTYYYILPLI